MEGSSGRAGSIDATSVTKTSGSAAPLAATGSKR